MIWIRILVKKVFGNPFVRTLWFQLTFQSNNISNRRCLIGSGPVSGADQSQIRSIGPVVSLVCLNRPSGEEEEEEQQNWHSTRRTQLFFILFPANFTGPDSVCESFDFWAQFSFFVFPSITFSSPILSLYYRREFEAARHFLVVLIHFDNVCVDSLPIYLSIYLFQCFSFSSGAVLHLSFCRRPNLNCKTLPLPVGRCQQTGRNQKPKRKEQQWL